jgi:hypothetical protein
MVAVVKLTNMWSKCGSCKTQSSAQICDIGTLILDLFFSRWKVCSQVQFIANIDSILIYLRLQYFE